MGNSDDLPSVTVIGLLPRQANKVQAEFGERLNLLFVDSDASTLRAKTVAESSDHVILMTRFIDHRVQDALRKHDGLIFCNGSVSSVDAILSTLYPSPKR